MKNAVSVVLDDRELVDLIQILIDDDAQGALTFVKRHFKRKARQLLEGG